MEQERRRRHKNIWIKLHKISYFVPGGGAPISSETRRVRQTKFCATNTIKGRWVYVRQATRATSRSFTAQIGSFFPELGKPHKERIRRNRPRVARVCCDNRLCCFAIEARINSTTWSLHTGRVTCCASPPSTGFLTRDSTGHRIWIGGRSASWQRPMPRFRGSSWGFTAPGQVASAINKYNDKRKVTCGARVLLA